MNEILMSLTHPDTWVALLTLTALEIVLGVDNIVFIAILSGRLPKARQKIAYQLGLAAALLSRLGLLFAISWVMGLTDDLFTVFDRAVSGRDLILLIGGIFLIGKSTHEIYAEVEHVEDPEQAEASSANVSMAGVVTQIMIMDLIFSLDSVITAVGMAKDFWVMATAMIAAVAVMLLFAKRIGDFVNGHPSMKVLALSFLLLIGVLLTAESFDQHIDKGYIYFAMSFALLVELVNMRMRKKRKAAA